MNVQLIRSRLSGPVTVVCAVASVVGPTSFLLGGPTALAWGLGWGLSAGLVWALLGNTRAGVVQGLSAGLCVGVGLGSFTQGLGILGAIVLSGVLWGGLGGIVLMFTVRSLHHVGFMGFLAFNFVAGALGTFVTGLLGVLLEGFDLSGAGFVIGVGFLSPCWALGNTAGMFVGRDSAPS